MGIMSRPREKNEFETTLEPGESYSHCIYFGNEALAFPNLVLEDLLINTPFNMDINYNLQIIEEFTEEVLWEKLNIRKSFYKFNKPIRYPFNSHYGIRIINNSISTIQFNVSYTQSY